MKNINIFYFLLFFGFFGAVYAQNNEENPKSIRTFDDFQVVPSIASRSILKVADLVKKEALDGRSSKRVLPPFKGNVQEDYFAYNPNPLSQKIASRTPSLVFETAASQSQPTDPSGAVGPNHYIAVFNTGFRIFDKNGSPLTGQLAETNIFPQAACCDLTVSYDNQADRWIMTVLGNNIQIAVSQGPDPVNDGWYIYTLAVNTDYQKVSVWHDGYYMTANTAATENVHAFEREKMLAGDSSAQIIGFSLTGLERSGFFSPQAVNISNSNFPTTGGAPIVFMQDDAYPNVTQDHIKLWTIDMDWETPGNSTISQPVELITTPFMAVINDGAWNNLQQPFGGQAVDAIQGTIMNQAQFRKFQTHNSVVFNFAVDVDPSTATKVGIRWYEIRQNSDGAPWAIYQEGTHVGLNNKDSAVASMIMDGQGNIGMGYSACGGDEDQYMSLYYTGRYANDPLGTMTISETIIQEGNGLIPSIRYGDYSKLDIDPVNDKAFWFVGELMVDGRKNYTGVFQITPDLSNDIGVVAISNPEDGTLSNTETITVTIFNYGQNPASNFDVSYQINGGLIVSETFTGTILSGGSESYTFNATGDFSVVGDTYSIISSTNYGADEDSTNNSFTKEVVHLVPNDLGLTAINAPVSAENMSASENVTVTIMNFGGETQQNFEIEYMINGVIVQEVVPGPLEGNASMLYTFQQTADLSTFGVYEIEATVSLVGDSNVLNDSLTVEVVNSNCSPESDCSFGDGFSYFELSTISNMSECSATGYSDFTDQVATVTEGETYPLTVTVNYGSQYVSVWIDFNDDFIFSSDELIITDLLIADGQDLGDYTETVDVVIPTGVVLGDHLLRAKSNWNETISGDACLSTEYGETEDYMVTILGEGLGVEEDFVANSVLLFDEIEPNVFNVSLESSEFKENLAVTVYTILGQRIVYHKVSNVDGRYTYKLNMSYATPGVYIFRIGNNRIGRIKKLIVK